MLKISVKIGASSYAQHFRVAQLRACSLSTVFLMSCSLINPGMCDLLCFSHHLSNLQLNIAKNTESILEGFIEGPLNFPPTYKFDVGTHTYDTRFVQQSPQQTFSIIFYFSRSWGLLNCRCPLWQSVASFVSVLRKGNLPGQIASFGAFVVPVPQFLPTMQHCRGVWPRGWVGRLKWHSMCTEVTWATPSATTSLFLPCFHYMWDNILPDTL